MPIGLYSRKNSDPLVEILKAPSDPCESIAGVLVTTPRHGYVRI